MLPAWVRWQGRRGGGLGVLALDEELCVSWKGSLRSVRDRRERAFLFLAVLAGKLGSCELHVVKELEEQKKSDREREERRALEL